MKKVIKHLVIKMKIIEIDLKKCIRCEECIKECPSQLFYKKDSDDSSGPKIIFQDENNGCIKCGHCLSICPRDAIIGEGIEEEGGLWKFEEVKDPSKILDLNGIMKLIRARRSIRRFQNKEIPKDQIELILEAMRYAPSASNQQSWHYIIVNDPEKIKHFGNQVMKLFYLLRKLLKMKWFLKLFVSGYQKEMLIDPKTELYITKMIKDFENGIDGIFYNAPCIIVLDSPKYGGMAGNDAGIALTHGMFAAQSQGIGTCWIGFAQEAIKRNKKLKKWLGIPKGRKCYGVIICGYPAMKFLKSPTRKKLHIKWL